MYDIIWGGVITFGSKANEKQHRKNNIDHWSIWEGSHESSEKNVFQLKYYLYVILNTKYTIVEDIITKKLVGYDYMQWRWPRKNSKDEKTKQN